MTARLWLRISSVITLFFAAGHTLGGLRYWSPMGANRSYLNFYTGFGYALAVACVVAH